MSYYFVWATLCKYKCTLNSKEESCNYDWFVKCSYFYYIVLPWIFTECSSDYLRIRVQRTHFYSSLEVSATEMCTFWKCLTFNALHCSLPHWLGMNTLNLPVLVEIPQAPPIHYLHVSCMNIKEYRANSTPLQSSPVWTSKLDWHLLELPCLASKSSRYTGPVWEIRGKACFASPCSNYLPTPM